jgi:hypothetical protein
MQLLAKAAPRGSGSGAAASLDAGRKWLAPKRLMSRMFSWLEQSAFQDLCVIAAILKPWNRKWVRRLNKYSAYPVEHAYGDRCWDNNGSVVIPAR